MTTLGGTMFTLHGATWTGDYVANPYQSALEWEWRPNAVSCPTPDACVIVEFVYTLSPGDPEPHSEGWADVVRGGTQHLERIPDAPDIPIPMVEAVDCLDLAHCLVVGGNVASQRHLARH